MDRNNKEPSISPTPDSDTTGHSVQTIIPKLNGQTHTLDNSKLKSQTINHNLDGDSTGHLYNTLADLSTSIKEKPSFTTSEPVISQNPQPNNTRASSTSTLITKPSENKFQIHIWLGTIQLLLSVALTALGGLVLARSASLAGCGAGIWSGGICGISGALGVINVRKTQTGFLAVSLICVASSTLAIALTGIGLVRDYNRSPATNKGAVSASSGLLMTLALHFIVSVLSVYFLALKLCLRSNSNVQTVNGIVTANNSTYLSQQRLEQYFQSLTIDSKRKNGYPAIISRSMLKAASEKNFNINDKGAELWIAQGRKQLASPVSSLSRQMILVPAGIRNSVPIMPMYTPPMLPPRQLPPMVYPNVPPGFIPYQPFPIPALAMENELALDHSRVKRPVRDRRSKRARRKSDSDIDARRAFTYTGMDREIAENFLEHQEKCNGLPLDYATGDDMIGKCPDVAM